MTYCNSLPTRLTTSIERDTKKNQKPRCSHFPLIVWMKPLVGRVCRSAKTLSGVAAPPRTIPRTRPTTTTNNLIATGSTLPRSRHNNSNNHHHPHCPARYKSTKAAAKLDTMAPKSKFELKTPKGTKDCESHHHHHHHYYQPPLLPPFLPGALSPSLPHGACT